MPAPELACFCLPCVTGADFLADINFHGARAPRPVVIYFPVSRPRTRPSGWLSACFRLPNRPPG